MINLNKIRLNAKTLVGLSVNISVFGVTKACLGSPEVAQAMIDGGVTGLADSRLPNLHKLKKRFNIPLLLLRQPMAGEIDRAVETADQIVVSETAVARALSQTARKKRKTVKLLLIIEMGDGREGITEDEFIGFVKTVKQLKAVTIGGLAANVGCSFGIAPTEKQLLYLVKLSRRATQVTGENIPILSGGNSSILPLLIAGKVPPEINQLRFGEAILLGCETANYQPVPGLATDAFILEAEVIEIKKKQLVTSIENRAVLALGRQDIAEALLTPLSNNIQFSARSSDHLVLTMTPGVKIIIGDTLRFIPSYFALLAAMTSPYVKKEFIGLPEH